MADLPFDKTNLPVNIVDDTSGNATVVDGAGNLHVTTPGDGSIGSAVPASAELAGAKDVSGNLQPLQVDAVGNLKVNASIVGPADLLVAGTITALNGAVQIALAGSRGSSIALSGVWVATLTPEASHDGGTNWYAVHLMDGGGVNAVSSSVSANGSYRFVLAGGMTHCRIRASAFTSGTVTVALAATSTPIQFTRTLTRLQDATTGNTAGVDTSGNLKVVTPPPTAPPNTTAKNASAQSVLAANAVVDTSYTVTNGKVLTIQNFTGGGQLARTSQNPPATAKIEIFYDPLGTGIGMTLIDAIYTSGSSYKFPEAYATAAGNGLIAIRMRRTNFGADTVEAYGRWDGYES